MWRRFQRVCETEDLLASPLVNRSVRFAIIFTGICLLLVPTAAHAKKCVVSKPSLTMGGSLNPQEAQRLSGATAQYLEQRGLCSEIVHIEQSCLGGTCAAFLGQLSGAKSLYSASILQAGSTFVARLEVFIAGTTVGKVVAASSGTTQAQAVGNLLVSLGVSPTSGVNTGSAQQSPAGSETTWQFFTLGLVRANEAPGYQVEIARRRWSSFQLSILSLAAAWVENKSLEGQLNGDDYIYNEGYANALIGLAGVGQHFDFGGFEAGYMIYPLGATWHFMSQGLDGPNYYSTKRVMLAFCRLNFTCVITSKACFWARMWFCQSSKLI